MKKGIHQLVNKIYNGMKITDSTEREYKFSFSSKYVYTRNRNAIMMF